MRGLIFLALAIRFMVLFMLLLGTNQICGRMVSASRLLCGALTGIVYAMACMKPELYFLGNRIWYFVFTLLIGMVAFGMERTAIRPITVFFLINLILDSVASDQTDLVSGAISLVGLAGLYLMSFWEHAGSLVPVQLTHNGRQIKLMALRDTGNRLLDPVTGKPMLVVGADIALQLLGLTPEQLKNPVETVGQIKGLRLVPYSTIGRSGALMLAMRIQEVKLGKQKNSALVAFAPENLGSKGTYQALTGGM